MKKELLKNGHRCRPGGQFEKTSLTIHSTGNPASSAQNERDWLDNPSNRREASWHYVVDEKGVIQAIPDDEEAWHCGNTIGNRFSIGLEICEGGDREKTLRNAVDFVVQKMKEYGFSLTDIVRHYDWTGKHCPRILMDKKYIKDGMDWNWFLRKIEEALHVEQVYHWTVEVPEWGRPTVQKLLDKGYLQGNEKGELELTYAMLKLLVINDRAGLYD